MKRKLPPQHPGDAVIVMHLALLALMILIYCKNCLSQAPGPALTRQVDLKVYYFRSIRQEINDGLNVIQLVPRVMDLGNRINLSVPLGIFQELIIDPPVNKVSEIMFFFSPMITGNIVKKDRLNLCLGAYTEIMMEKGQRACPLFGLTTGLGMCNKSRNLFFSTDFGIDFFSFRYGAALWNIGFTIAYQIESIRARNRLMPFNQDRFLASFSKVVSLYSGIKDQPATQIAK